MCSMCVHCRHSCSFLFLFFFHYVQSSPRLHVATENCFTSIFNSTSFKFIFLPQSFYVYSRSCLFILPIFIPSCGCGGVVVRLFSRRIFVFFFSLLSLLLVLFLLSVFAQFLRFFIYTFLPPSSRKYRKKKSVYKCVNYVRIKSA